METVREIFLCDGRAYYEYRDAVYNTGQVLFITQHPVSVVEKKFYDDLLQKVNSVSPTQWAYDQACEALDNIRKERNTLYESLFDAQQKIKILEDKNSKLGKYLENLPPPSPSFNIGNSEAGAGGTGTSMPLTPVLRTTLNKPVGIDPNLKKDLDAFVNHIVANYGNAALLSLIKWREDESGNGNSNST